MSGGSIFGVVDAGHRSPITPVYQWANPHCLYTHNALSSPGVIYGVVIVSRNLERANENDGFKMTALEKEINKGKIKLIRNHSKTIW